jgi:hypothetical protein
VVGSQEKWYLLKRFQEWGGRSNKGDGGGGEFKYDLFVILNDTRTPTSITIYIYIYIYIMVFFEKSNFVCHFKDHHTSTGRSLFFLISVLE